MRLDRRGWTPMLFASLACGGRGEPPTAARAIGARCARGTPFRDTPVQPSPVEQLVRGERTETPFEDIEIEPDCFGQTAPPIPAVTSVPRGYEARFEVALLIDANGWVIDAAVLQGDRHFDDGMVRESMLRWCCAPAIDFSGRPRPILRVQTMVVTGENEP